MHAPQIILICILVFSGTCKLIFHGEEREVSFPAFLIDAAIWLWLLWWGGFFNG